jgi:hypothetical protein
MINTNIEKYFFYGINPEIKILKNNENIISEPIKSKDPDDIILNLKILTVFLFSEVKYHFSLFPS